MWASLIVALISFFLSKKSGKSDAQSAAVAAAAGIGTYYVASETDWGKSSIGSLNDSIAGATGFGYMDSKTGTAVTGAVQPVLKADGTQATNAAGQPLWETAINPVAKDSDGNPVKAADGSIANSLISGTAHVLSSWGGLGTSAVIGTTAAVTSKGGVDDFVKKYGAWIGAGALLFVLAR